MINIQKEIQSIVQDQDFIVLPGIGAFSTEYTKPYFDKEERIVPPLKKLKFNQLIDRDVDNKLFSILVKKNNISVDIIKTEYNQFLKKFRFEIVTNQKFNLDLLGTFYKNESQELIFYAEENNKYTYSVFTESKAEPIVNFREEINNEVSEIEYEENIKSKSRNTLKLLLYSIPLFIIISALAYTIFIKPTREKSDKKNMVEEIDSLTILQKEILDLPKTMSEKNSSKSKDENKSKKKNDTSVDSSGSTKSNSHIVGIGMFKVKENVDNLAARLAENGIPARVRRSGTKYKLFVTASSPEQAQEFMQKIEQLTGEKAVYENN